MTSLSSLGFPVVATVAALVIAWGCGVPEIQDTSSAAAGVNAGHAGSVNSAGTAASSGGLITGGTTGTAGGGAGAGGGGGAGGYAGTMGWSGTPPRVGCHSAADCSTNLCDFSESVGGAGGDSTAGSAGASALTGTCVECLPTPTDTHCGAGLYCSADKRCEIGCKADQDCKGLTCNLETHRCTGCADSTGCPAYTACDTATTPGVCVPSCSEMVSNSCPPNWGCCGGACRDLQNDAAHCGACSTPCVVSNGAPLCAGGVCTVGLCIAGFADCNLSAKDGCETNTTGNPAHCGGCNRACSQISGSPVCSSSVCTIGCNLGFADCNHDVSDGCETSLMTNVNCGACGTLCQPLRATAYACQENGYCHVTQCAAGWADCNADSVDGCEVNLLGELANCGACTKLCRTSNATPACSAGECVIASCNTGYYDCNGSATDGCEINLTNDARHCGTCGTDCLAGQHVTAAQCVNGVCSVTSCEEGYGDCSGGAADGCETNLNINVNHCRTCGNACPIPSGGTPKCAQGVCTISTCIAPLEDCTSEVGCETDTNSSVTNCGGCGTTCSYSHAEATCATGLCAMGACATGWGNCANGSTDGCETELNTLANCAGCGLPCARDNATATCATGACLIAACSTGYDDCTGGDADGCETPLNTLTSCGSCGVPCGAPHASTSCASGTCQVIGCESGYDDCTGGDADGCETPLGTIQNCSGCGAACAYDNAAPLCSGGVCVMGACANGFRDCNTSSTDGCETDVRTNPNKCGDCNKVCSSVHGTPGCSNGTCSIGCDQNWGNCNNDVSDGCEKSLLTNDASNCGACGRTCPSATPFCLSGVCANHLDISLIGTPSSGTIGGQRALTFNHDLATAAATDSRRLVVVVVAARGNGLSAIAPATDGVTYNGALMTPVTAANWAGTSPNDVWTGIYYLRSAALPAGTGSYPVSITTGTISNYAQAIVAAAFELTGVDQTTTTVDTATVVGNGSNCYGSPPAASVTTAADGDFVVDVVGYNEGDSVAAVTSSGQTKVLDAAPTDYTNFYGVAGYKNRVSPAGLTPMNWSNAKYCSRHTHSVAAFRRASS